MRTVALMSLKGGSGKTTLSVHLAVAAQLAGQRVSVIDLDPQASAFRWGKRRKVPPTVRMTQAAALTDMLADLQPHTDWVVVDTPPAAESAHRDIVAASDLVLIPSRPSILDLDAIETTWALTKSLRKPAYVVLNAAAHNRPGIVEAAQDRLKRSNIEVLDEVIFQRANYTDALAIGSTASEQEPGGKAALDINGLYERIKRNLKSPRLRVVGGG